MSTINSKTANYPLFSWIYVRFFHSGCSATSCRVCVGSCVHSGPASNCPDYYNHLFGLEHNNDPTDPSNAVWNSPFCRNTNRTGSISCFFTAYRKKDSGFDRVKFQISWFNDSLKTWRLRSEQNLLLCPLEMKWKWVPEVVKTGCPIKFIFRGSEKWFRLIMFWCLDTN